MFSRSKHVPGCGCLWQHLAVRDHLVMGLGVAVPCAGLRSACTFLDGREYSRHSFCSLRFCCTSLNCLAGLAQLSSIPSHEMTGTNSSCIHCSLFENTCSSALLLVLQLQRWLNLAVFSVVLQLVVATTSSVMELLAVVLPQASKCCRGSVC